MRKTIIGTFCFLYTSLALIAQTTWYNPMDADIPYLNGRGWNQEIGKDNYSRLPDRFKDKVTPSVWRLSRHTTGMSVRFITDAKKIQVRFINYNEGKNYPNVVSLNHSGVDLYATDVDGKTTWVPNEMVYTFSVNKSDTAQFTFTTEMIPNKYKRGVSYELFLPSYNGIKWLSVGVEKGAQFKFVRESQEKPIVIYGTSITQGASASRPGTIWTTMLKRKYEYPIINLGFSGSAKIENIMFDALSEIDAKLYILDYVANCAGLDNKTFEARLRYGIKKIREKSDAPIIFTEGQALCDNSTYLHKKYQEQYDKDSIQYAVYQEMKAKGEKNFYYIQHKDLGFTSDDFIEGVHPNDMGMKKYVEAYSKVLDKVLVGEDTMRCYTPCAQRRDGCYEWMTRHNEILELNRKTDPEILMIGNSITHFWGGQPASRNNGGKTWEKLFGKHRVTNMGMGWDKVENVYWRILHGELDNCAPRQICLMIGTNNIAEDSDEKIVSGICDIVKLIRKKQPQAQLHVVKVYPRKGKEDRVKRLNNLLEKELVCDEKTDIQDVSSCLTLSDGSGKIDPSCFIEGLHPNEKGYAKLAKAYRNFLFKK